VSENSCAVPSELRIASVNVSTSSEPFNNVANAVTARWSVNSNIAFKSTPLACKFCNAGTNWSTLVTEPPNATDNGDVESANFKNIFLNDVPAVLASMLAFTNVPNNAVVPSKSKPNAFAAAPTFGIAFVSFVKSNALFENATANTSVTCAACDASNSKDRKIPPTCSPVAVKSSPNANAKFKTLSVILLICVGSKPNFANSF